MILLITDIQIIGQAQESADYSKAFNEAYEKGGYDYAKAVTDGYARAVVDARRRESDSTISGDVERITYRDLKEFSQAPYEKAKLYTERPPELVGKIRI